MDEEENDLYRDLTKEYENWMTLSDIVEYIPDIKLSQLNRWSEPGRGVGFPSPKQTIGRYRLYDRDEVIKWVYLWQKVNKNLGRFGKEKKNG